MSDIPFEEPAVQEPAATETAATPTSPGLQIADLVAVVQLISAVSQRGAIQAVEMSQVGGLFDRLVAFLETNGAITKPATPATPEPTAQEN